MHLSEIFLKSAETGLRYQREDGSMPPGQNGPHGDPETPVRNTSHWLIIYLKAFYLSDESRFEKASRMCMKYLGSREARPMNATYFHRKNPKKDFSNGVMGQAWTIEALIYAYHHFGDSWLLDTATEVFNLHPYNENVQCWSVVNVDGSIRGFDTTFNHQLWFASVGCRLISRGAESVKEPTLNFVNHIHENLELYSDGVIKHRPYGYARPDSARKKIGYLIHRAKEKINQDQRLYRHSLGYHGFNAYALSVIRKCLQDHPFFQTDAYRKCIELYKRKGIETEMAKTKFGYPYNPPGIEAAVSIQAAEFWSSEEKEKLISQWLQNQFNRSFDFEAWRMEKSTPDPITLQARLYELYSLDNFEYEIALPSEIQASGF